MKTLLIVSLLCLGAAAARAADAPAKPVDQKKCDQIDAELTKLYAQKSHFLITFKARHFLAERKKLNCPGNPPEAPKKK